MEFPEDSQVSSEARQLICAMLDKDPAQRLDAAAVLACRIAIKNNCTCVQQTPPQSSSGYSCASAKLAPSCMYLYKDHCVVDLSSATGGEKGPGGPSRPPGSAARPWPLEARIS